jgi:hypothetical protein
MSHATLQWMDVKGLRKQLRFVSILASCTVVVCFMVQQSSGQSVAVVGAPQSIISLAPSAKLPAESIARRPGDAKFENTPANYRVFPATAVGDNNGVETLTLKFAAETRLTGITSRNKDFVVETGGTCRQGDTYNFGSSCSVLVRFNPQGPGHRLGFLRISHTAEPTPASFGLTGNGYAPVISFTPALISTVPGTVSAGVGTFNGATHMAIDGGDVLYIADIGNNKIKEIDSTGTINTTNPAFATPAAIAVDTAGIMYSTNVSGSTYYFSDFTPWGVQTAFGYTYVSTSCTVSAPCAFSTVGMSSPANISIDNNDNLFFLEGTTGSAEMPVASLGQGTGTLNLWHLKNQYAYASGGPGSFAVDAYGDLYTNYTYTPNSTCILLEENLYNAEYSPTANRVAGGVKCGFSGDGGQARGAEISTVIGQMAFDIAGNLYFADAGNQRIRRVDAITGIITTIAGNGTAGYTGDGGPAISATLASPTGIGVDSQGQVYIISSAPAAGPTQVIRKVGANGARGFATTTVGKSSPAQSITVSNTGNASLNFTQSGQMTGTNATEFAIDPTSTTCDFTPGNQLAAGRSCLIGIIFKPSAVGTRTATLKLLDNTVTSNNLVNLKGTAVAAAVVKITAPTANAQITAKTASNFTVSVTSTRAGQPTGTVTFKADGKKIGSPVTVSAGAASTKLSALGTGSHTLSATYNGDAKHAAATATETISVQ